MRIAHFDPVGGAAGDMILAALIDAGVPPAAIRGLVAKLRLGGVRIAVRTERRSGIRVRRVDVVLPGPRRTRPTRLAEVLARIARAPIPEEVRARASAIFRRLAEAEAAAHGTTVGRVHLHEAGARDALVDVVGAALGLSILGVDRVSCAPLPLGRGHVKTAHGPIPLPGPATAEILRGHEVRFTGIEGEQTTPTGAAILATLCGTFRPPPPFRLERTGIGAGSRPDGEAPNVLRVFIGEMTGGRSEEVWILETGIDDMNPEHYTHLFDLLHAGGALEVSLAPVVMKKSRPGTILRVLAPPDRVATLEEAILRETSTFGIRRLRAERTCIDRELIRVRTPYGFVRVKVGRIGGEIVTRSPEFEDCRRAAARHRVPLKQVYESAADHARP